MMKSRKGKSASISIDELYTIVSQRIAYAGALEKIADLSLKYVDAATAANEAMKIARDALKAAAGVVYERDEMN